MYWCFYSLVGIVFLLAPHHVLADERTPSPLVLSAGIETSIATTGLLLPTHDFFSVGESFRHNFQNGEVERKDPLAPVKAQAFVYRTGPPSLLLPAFVQDLVGPWLLRPTSRNPLVVSADKTKGHPVQTPWPAKQSTPLPRLDKVWQVAPVRTLARPHDRLTIDGDVDLGLEVHAGSSKKDRASNTIKGTASSRVTLLPAGFLEQRFGHYRSMMGTDEETGHSRNGQLHMGVVTNGAYALNPNTRVITPTGEVVGTLSWMTTARERFTQDPWRVVAFRWYPTVSCEGRRLMGEGKNHAEANRVPLATLTGSLHGDLRLDFLSPKLAASGTYHYRQRLTNAQTKWEQASVSWKYQLNPRVSVGGSFTHGKVASNQPTERRLALEMGVVF